MPEREGVESKRAEIMRRPALGDRAATRPFALPKLQPASLPAFATLAETPLPKAQRALAAITHQSEWLDLHVAVTQDSGGSLRDATRLVSVSQPGATDFHKVIPSRWDLVMGSQVTLFATQRQLGVPLSCMTDTDDPHGDAALNSNVGDFTLRHNMGLAAWVKALRKAYRGFKVNTSCTLGGSDRKPDAAIEDALRPGDHIYVEYKMLSSLKSNGEPRNDDATEAAFAGVSDIFSTIEHKYRSHLNDGIRKHSLKSVVTDCFGGVHREGVKFLKDSGARLRGRDGAGNDPAVPLVVDPTSEDECDSSDSSRSSGPTANPFFSLSMQSISLTAHKALAAHAMSSRSAAPRMLR